MAGILDSVSSPADLQRLSVAELEALAQEIRERSLSCLRAAAPAGPFILANSGGDLPLDTPTGNVKALREASEAFAARRLPG